MPLRDDDVVAGFDATFLALVSAVAEHPRSEGLDTSARDLATWVQGFHTDTGVPISAEVQAALDWALSEERDAETGRTIPRRNT